MERASPINQRQSLEMVEVFKKAGIDFIPVPVGSEEERAALLEKAFLKLGELENKCSSK